MDLESVPKDGSGLERRDRVHVPLVRSFCHNFAKKTAIKRPLRKAEGCFVDCRGTI